MSTLLKDTGIGCFTCNSLEEKVRIGLNRCKTDNALNCGNCSYCFLKNEEENDITKCTSALAADAEEFINSILGNKAHFIGVIE